MSNSEAYRIEDEPGRHTVLTLLPPLNDVDWASLEQLGNELLERIRQSGRPSVLVDLLALQYMGSAKIALLVRIFKAVRERSGTFVVVCNDPLVLQELQLTGLAKLWTIVPARASKRKLAPEDAGTSARRVRAAVFTTVGLIHLAVATLMAGLATVMGGKAAWGLLLTCVILASLSFLAAVATFVAGSGFRKLAGLVVVLAAILGGWAGVELSKHGVPSVNLGSGPAPTIDLSTSSESDNTGETASMAENMGEAESPDTDAPKSTTPPNIIADENESAIPSAENPEN